MLEYAVGAKSVTYRWTNVVPGFDMPIKVHAMEGGLTKIYPTETWKSMPNPAAIPKKFRP